MMIALVVAAVLPAMEPPVIDKPVVDLAEVLDSYEESDLADELKGLRAEGGAQMAVLLVRSTAAPIEDLANATATAWGGDVLLVIAIGDRRVRLEVGDGLEARLPDSEAARIVDMAAASFRGSRWREGAGIIVNAVGTRLEYERLGIAPPQEKHGLRGLMTAGGLVAALAVLMMILRARFARRRGAEPLPYAGAPRAGDDDVPFEARLPPEGAGNAFAGQMAREREAFQKDPESTASSSSVSSSASIASGMSSSTSSTESTSSSSNTGGKGGGGSFSGGGASGSF